MNTPPPDVPPVSTSFAPAGRFYPRLFLPVALAVSLTLNVVLVFGAIATALSLHHRMKHHQHCQFAMMMMAHHPWMSPQFDRFAYPSFAGPQGREDHWGRGGPEEYGGPQEMHSRDRYDGFHDRGPGDWNHDGARDGHWGRDESHGSPEHHETTDSFVRFMQGPGHKPTPAEMAAKVVDNMKKDLALTDDESAKIQPLIEEAITTKEQTMEQAKSTVDAAMTQARDKVKAELTPDQQKKLTDMVP